MRRGDDDGGERKQAAAVKICLLKKSLKCSNAGYAALPGVRNTAFASKYLEDSAAHLLALGMNNGVQD